jgi:hypothetical protein
MNDVITYLPWLMSAVTIWQVILSGNLHRHAWIVGLCNQALWLTWIIAAGQWGFLPMNIALWITFARNHMKWRRANMGR